MNLFLNQTLQTFLLIVRQTWITSSDASICSAMALPPLGNSDHAVVSVSIDFSVNSKQDAPFHRIAYDYSRSNWDGLRDHFKLNAFTTASEF